ncbi:MAG: hypothetical protein ACYS8Y_10500 [Planctomycetota bacterium]
MARQESELIMLLQFIKTGRNTYLYLLGLLNGLAIANHMWAVIPLTCYLVFFVTLVVQKRIGLKYIAVTAALWVIGAAPYEYLIIKNTIQSGDFTATLSSAFFGNTWQQNVLNTTLSWQMVRQNLLFLAYNFATLNGLFLFAGLYCIWKLSPKRAFANILLAQLILFFIFAFRYTVIDRYAFFIPFYCIGSVVGGLGLSLITQPKLKILRLIVFVFILLPIPTYIIAPWLAQKVHFKLPTKRTTPCRNDYTWFLRPWKTGYNGTEQFANEAFALVEKNAVIYADGTTVYALLYAQEIKNQNPDIRIVSSHPNRKNPIELNEQTVPRLLQETSIYVVSPVTGYCPQFLLDQYEFKQVGILWKVVESGQQKQM